MATTYTKDELRNRLTPLQYQVTQESSTERPFTGKYNKFYEKGVYRCIVCHEDLFTSDTKYDSGCGWPAFNDVLEQGKVTLHKDTSISGNTTTTSTTYDIVQFFLSLTLPRYLYLYIWLTRIFSTIVYESIFVIYSQWQPFICLNQLLAVNWLIFCNIYVLLLHMNYANLEWTHNLFNEWIFVRCLKAIFLNGKIGNLFKLWYFMRLKIGFFYKKFKFISVAFTHKFVSGSL